MSEAKWEKALGAIVAYMVAHDRNDGKAVLVAMLKHVVPDGSHGPANEEELPVPDVVVERKG